MATQENMCQSELVQGNWSASPMLDGASFNLYQAPFFIDVKSYNPNFVEQPSAPRGISKLLEKAEEHTKSNLACRSRQSLNAIYRDVYPDYFKSMMNIRRISFQDRLSSDSPVVCDSSGKTTDCRYSSFLTCGMNSSLGRKRPPSSELTKSNKSSRLQRHSKPSGGLVKNKTRLNLSVLKELDSESNTNLAGPNQRTLRDTPSSFTRGRFSSVINFLLTDEQSTDFLLSIKDQVANIRGKKERGALELAELRFEKGALLSASSGDSALEDEEDDLHSVKSNKATVVGRISPEKAKASLRAQLKREGKSESLIKFELACHIKTEEARLMQQERRSRFNNFIMRRHRQYAQGSARLVSGISPSAVRIFLGLFSGETSGTKNLSTTSNMMLNVSSTSPASSNAILSNESSKCRESENQGKQANQKEFTRDDRIVACRRQKAITLKLANLQKRRDRGELTTLDFEKSKAEIFKEIFETDDQGHITVRRSSWSAICTLGIQKHKRFCKTAQQQRFDGIKSLVSIEDTDLDFMNETDRERGNVSDEDDDDLEQDIGSKGHVAWKEQQAEIYSDVKILGSYTINHKHIRRQLIKKMRNFERREMLMRRFDQRAPPAERMFKQDTSLTLDGSPTQQQKENWCMWYTPLQLLPDWMKAVKRDRLIIFPDDIKKL